MRSVIDTGVLVSALIRRQGTTGEVLRLLRDGQFTAVYSTDILVEIIDVLGRPALRAKYHIEADDIRVVINVIRLRGDLVIPTRKVTACRDPKDDKFLEAALAGKADAIISGDADLLVLNPFEEIPILRPAEFLARC
ncbi:MAG: putative toxin-antitoxin system toxin component, PIN family [Chloroflexi bacterium]|nr:putative toxin-antitoxin system toxin component, PIN family [Chloroflexota bacterium]MBE3117574.1 putative toxin-antitoxin system toxin component, PIN family [Candidatus Atribacteria bacterium]